MLYKYNNSINAGVIKNSKYFFVIFQFSSVDIPDLYYD